MTPTETLSLSEIRKQVQDSRSTFASSASPYAGKIDTILKEFDDFAGSYQKLWNEISTKIPLVPQSGEAVGERLDELWESLQLIVNQYKDAKYQSKVEDGMKYLEQLCRSNPYSFPPGQPKPDVLIFIEEDRSIARKYPYTNTFFIGINKFSANLDNDPQKETDWKPVAHELGHYIYWNSRFKTKGNQGVAGPDDALVFLQEIEKAFETDERPSPSKALKNRALTALMGAWSEEIFADFIGTLLLGREFVSSAQQLFINQTTGQIGNHFTSDIEHPTAYLRSFVCAESLKVIEEKGNRVWSGFKTAVENELGENRFDTEDLQIGLLSMDGQNSIGFEEVAFDTDTLQNAIKVVIPILYDFYHTSTIRTDQKNGISLIEARMSDVFCDSYLDISDVLEKGDGPGFKRKVRKVIKTVLTKLR